MQVPKAAAKYTTSTDDDRNTHRQRNYGQVSREGTTDEKCVVQYFLNIHQLLTAAEKKLPANNNVQKIHYATFELSKRNIMPQGSSLPW